MRVRPLSPNAADWHLYALLHSGWSLTDILDAVAVQAPQLNRAQLLRSLVYFADAEQEPEPRVLRPWSWPEIRQTLERQVYAYLRRTLPPGPHGTRDSDSSRRSLSDVQT